MDYAQRSTPAGNVTGVGAVIAFHVVLVGALVSGLAHTKVEPVPKPHGVTVIREAAPPKPEPQPLKPLLPPPAQPYVPDLPPIIVGPRSDPGRTITGYVPPQRLTPPAIPRQVVHAAPKVTSRGCRVPEYPAMSARMGESGTVVLQLLVNVDGKVTASKVEQSSGYPRLDQAARDALSLCQFVPGTVDGKPEQAWGRISYAFDNPDP
jgi:protein TonB